MSKYSQKKVSDKTKDDAMKIARGTQRQGQTKEQTKLIAHGIKKGIDQYKKQQSAKARELDKRLKKATINSALNKSPPEKNLEAVSVKNNNLPWLLLIISWLGFAVYLVFIK